MSLSYTKMLELVKKGIGESKYTGAFKNANYLGNPGKDIYFWLETELMPNEPQIYTISKNLSRHFPKKPPHNPIQYGACVRYIYGCFEKQGILRSGNDKKRMIESKQSWERSVKFIEHLYNHFMEQQNFFGLSLLSEQMAHRYGDRYFIDNDEINLKLMEDYYMRAYNFALKCVSKKHLMTIFYWEGRYWAEIGNKEKAIYYYRKAVESANSYCPDARNSLKDKIMDEFKYLAKHDPNYKEFRAYWKKKAINKAVKVVVKNSPKG